MNDSDGNLIGIIGLENKLDSSEQEEQLSDYQKALSATFPFVPKIILYCTPNGRASETAIKNFIDCPCLPINYSSFKNVFEHFSKLTEGEIQLIFNSTHNYLEIMQAREKKREILSSIYDPSLPFNERNKYSPLMIFLMIFMHILKHIESSRLTMPLWALFPQMRLRYLLKN